MTGQQTSDWGIKLDNTLAEQSAVNSDDDCITFTGNAVAKNLFYSFEQLDVAKGKKAIFKSPSNDIQNILVRVKSDRPSEIQGTIETELADVNLILINTKGFVFGPSASLNINGSLIVTTASAVQYSEFFHGVPESDEPQASPDSPSAFIFQDEAQSIVISGARLEVPEGQSLLLIGGSVKLEGSELLAPKGRIEIGGLASAGVVKLNADNDLELLASFPNNVVKADVSLEAALVDVAGDGGSVAINANTIEITGGSDIIAGLFDSDSAEAQAGDITLVAKNISIVGSTISNDVEGLENSQVAGCGGDIHIQAESLSLADGAELKTSASGEGIANSILMQVEGPVSLVDSAVFANTFGQGNTGDVRVDAESLLLDEASLNASSFGQGDAGNVFVQVINTVSLIDSSIVAVAESETDSGTGLAGEITVRSKKVVLGNGFELLAHSSEKSLGKIQIEASAITQTSESALAK